MRGACIQEIVFCMTPIVVCGLPVPRKFALKVTPSFPAPRLRPISAYRASTEPGKLAKKVQLALLGSRPRAFQ